MLEQCCIESIAKTVSAVQGFCIGGLQELKHLVALPLNCRKNWLETQGKICGYYTTKAFHGTALP